MGVLLLFLQCSCPRSSLSALQNIALKCRLTVDHGLLTNGYDTVINVKEDCIMRQDLSELIFIIDRSGSMYGLESDTIGGFNRVLEENAKAPGECNITTYFFSDHAELIHDRIPVRGVHPITSKDYIVGGCTALLDTLGTAISSPIRRRITGIFCSSVQIWTPLPRPDPTAFLPTAQYPPSAMPIRCSSPTTLWSVPVSMSVPLPLRRRAAQSGKRQWRAIPPDAPDADSRKACPHRLSFFIFIIFSSNLALFLLVKTVGV